MSDLFDIVAANVQTRMDHLGVTAYAVSVANRLPRNWMTDKLRHMGRGNDITLFTLDQLAVALGEEPARLLSEEYDPGGAPPPKWRRAG